MFATQMICIPNIYYLNNVHFPMFYQFYILFNLDDAENDEILLKNYNSKKRFRQTVMFTGTLFYPFLNVGNLLFFPF